MPQYSIKVLCFEKNGIGGSYVWKELKPTQGPPYRYNTREEAEKIARICYPENADKVKVEEA